MASQQVVGRYKLYKQGTRNLVYWLTVTAEQYCDLKTVIRALRESESSPQQARPAGLEVRQAELVQLAELIATAEPPPDVPEGIVLIAKDVIQGRECCAEWYSAQALQTGSDLEKENDGHKAFILVRFKCTISNNSGAYTNGCRSCAKS